jgi:WD40 repeat protein
MKLLIVRMLVPPYFAPVTPARPVAIRASLLDDSPATETQASQARAALAIADREEAAIQIHCTTFAPQTADSTPAVAWRPNGSGVWVNGDDGAIRGIEVSTGKLVSTLQGHEEGSKVRSIWAGEVDGDELLVSGGFDQKLIVWQAPS